jgi:hypothetical protein
VTENSQPILAHANASNAELHLRDPIVGSQGLKSTAQGVAEQLQ